MKIATFNTNSIRARTGIISGWIKSQRPDVLCLQETKVQDRDFPADVFAELGYQVIFKGQRSYNGVAILSGHPVSDPRTNLTENPDEQARFISAVTADIHIINVYVPQGVAPGTDKFLYKLQWMEGLLSHLKTCYVPGMPLIMAGDFNVALEPIDLYDPEGMKGQAGFHPEEQAMLKRIMEWGLVDIFRMHHREGGHYTFWDYRIQNGLKRNMGWRIDYIFATRPLAAKSTNVWIDTNIRGQERPSDHTFLTAEFDV